MTRFVDLVADKNAAEFQQQLEHSMSEKAGLALDARKAQIAQSLFNVEEAPVTEETQQIDELSKKTLGSYVDKAAEQLGDNAYQAGAENRRDRARNMGALGKHHVYKVATRRLHGIKAAAKKLGK